MRPGTRGADSRDLGIRGSKKDQSPVHLEIRHDTDTLVVSGEKNQVTEV